MLATTHPHEKSDQTIKEEVYLTFNHRPQRIVIYNLTFLLWSISNLLYYSDVVSDKHRVTLYHHSTNNFLLVYNLMVCIASFCALFTFYVQMKVKDLNGINISFSITGNLVELPIIDGINLFVGLIYFLSFLLHFGITWKMCGDVCSHMDKPLGCNITIISSTLFSVIFPVILCADIVDNFLRNPSKRILFVTLFIFLATFTFICTFQSNDYATAIIYIVEGFYHEGVLKKYFEIIVSFVLLCSPIAYNCHVIEFNGVPASHSTWFIIVILSICMSYDLQKLDSFLFNVIGAQSTVRERFITAPPTDFNINTPSVYKKPKKIYTAPNSNIISVQGNINGPDDDKDDLMYGSNEDFEDSDKDDSRFSYLVFKKFSFRLDNKKQRLLILNILLLIYSVGHFIYYFNFWINFNESSFNHMKQTNFADFAMNLKKETYVWYCISFVVMIIISISVIIMEWWVINQDCQNKFKFYRYSCGVLYIVSSIIQIVAVIFGTNDYCTHLSRSIENNGNYYCHMQYVSTKLIFVMIPLFILSIDIIGVSTLLFAHTRIRVVAIHFILSLSCVLFYVGYYNYYNNLSSYVTTKLTGHLMITFSFIFSTVMSPLFLYLHSDTFSNLSNFISSLLIIVGAAFVLDVNNMHVNISEWALFIPICCLVSYEIQIL
eukprot:452128_1